MTTEHLSSEKTTDVEAMLRRIEENNSALRIWALWPEQAQALIDCARALVHADKAMEAFDEDAVCDHSVGVCWCSYLKTREAMQDALKRLEALK